MSLQRKLIPTHFDSKRLRVQLALILMITIGMGTAFGRLLLYLGLTSLVIRNTVVFPVTYFIFFVCVYFWRKRVDRFESLPAKKELTDKIQHQSGRSDRDNLSWLGDVGFDFGEATIIFALVVIIICVIVWIFGEAPAIMSEAFFDIGLTASLAGALRKRHSSFWYIGLFRKTIVAFLAFYFASLLLLVLANTTCPNRPTLTKIVRECWIPMRATIK